MDQQAAQSDQLQIDPMQVIEEIKQMQPNGQLMLDLAVQRIVSKQQNEIIQQLSAQQQGEDQLQERARKATPKKAAAKK